MPAAEPTELRPKRVAVSFSEREHAVLQEMAARERIPLAKAVLRIVRGHLATGRPAPDGTRDPTGESASASPGRLPPIEKAEYAGWARDRAAAVQSLLDRYPDELAHLPRDWHRVAAVGEQLWALSWWRDLLDSGTYDDPRMELAFAASLGDYARYLRERRRPGTRRRD